MKVKKILCVAALIAAVIILLPTSAAAAGRFSDVKSGAWYYDAVEYVAERGIMMGTTDTEFSPTKSMTRAQLVTVLYRLSGTTETGFSDKLTFKDTKKSAWYAEYVGWAVEKGLVGGYTDNTFKPDRAVTRQEIAKLLVEFFSMMNIDVSHCTPLSDSFSDAGKFQSWSREYIDALRKTGLIAGDGNGNFNPAKSATRAEIATILKRYFETIYDEMYFIDGKLDELKCPKHRQIHYSVAYDEDDGYETAVSLRMIGDSVRNYLGLDEETYTVTVTSGTQTDLEYNLDSPMAQLRMMCSFSIKNNVTGAVTAQKKLSFIVFNDPFCLEGFLGKCPADEEDTVLTTLWEGLEDSYVFGLDGKVRVPANVLDSVASFDKYLLSNLFGLYDNYASYQTGNYKLVYGKDDAAAVTALRETGGEILFPVSVTSVLYEKTTDEKVLPLVVMTDGECKAFLEELQLTTASHIAELGRLTDLCHESGIPTDYEDAAIEVLEKFDREFIVECYEKNDFVRLNYFEKTLDKLYADAKLSLEGYLAGTKPIVNVPRYVTSKVETDGFSQYADTVDSFGKTERRPVYFYGFGDGTPYSISEFDTMREIGFNGVHYYDFYFDDAIKPADGKEHEHTSPDGKYYIDTAEFEAKLSVLDKHAENDLSCSLLFARDGDVSRIYPEISADGTFGFNPLSPEGRAMVEDCLRTLLPLVRDYPCIRCFVLTNEPSFDPLTYGDYFKGQWADFLEDIYTDVSKLNTVYGTSYKSFDEVPMVETREEKYMQNRQSYDGALFAAKLFAEWHGYMADVCHEICPDIPVTIKLKTIAFERALRVYGYYPELLSDHVDLAGCDDVRGDVFYYDQLAYAEETQVVDSEIHLYHDTWNETYNAEMDDWTDTSVWRAFVHHLGSGTIWSWDYQMQGGSATQSTYGLYLFRPTGLYALGRAALDANRFSRELDSIVTAHESFAVLNSYVSRQYNVNYTNYTAYCVYNALLQSGEKVRIVSDLQTEKINKCEVLVVPMCENVTEETLRTIYEFSENGGKVIIIGKNSLKKDDFDVPFEGEEKLLADGIHAKATSTSTMEGVPAYRRFFESYIKENSLQRVWLEDADTGRPAEGVEWQWGELDGNIYVTAYLLRGKGPVRARLTVDGNVVAASEELRSGVSLGEVFTLELNRPVLIKVGSGSDGEYGKSVEVQVRDGYSYILKDGNAKIVKCDLTDAVVTVPGTVDGHPVTEIGAYAFAGLEAKEITLPGSIEVLGTGAFAICRNLEKVSGISAEIIPDNCFFLCSSLKSAKLGENTSEIGEAAFFMCTSLPDFTIPDSVRVIDDRAFAYCASATSIDLPETADYIGELAFKNCRLWTGELKIPYGIEELNYWCFCGCSGITSVSVPDTVKWVRERALSGMYRVDRLELPGSILCLEHAALEGTGHRVVIGDGTRHLGLWLCGCEIEIPSSVTKIDGSSLFTKIYCEAGSYAEEYAIENGAAHEIIK